MAIEENKLLYDTSFLPALLDDYGFYLIKKSLNDFECNSGLFSTPNQVNNGKKSIQNVLMADKKLGVVSTIDFLHWEHDKFRIYIDTLRLSRLCEHMDEMDLLGDFIGRTVLVLASKLGYSSQIHCDYAIVGTDRVYRASEKERKQDVKMIHKVRALFSGKDYLDVSSSGTLFPNLKANYKGVFKLDEDEKKEYQKICNDVCDVSVVWQCGIKRRRLLREKKIYSWNDPSFEDHFYEMVSSPLRVGIIKKMLSLSLGGEDDLLFPPKQDVLEKFPVLEKNISSWVFVDFETDYQKCIYLLGYYTADDGYQCQWADHLDPGAEKPLMLKVYSVLSSYKKKGFVLCYFVAEMNFWKERCVFHRMKKYMDLFDGMVDLSHVFIYSPLIIRNVFNFKLKNIASKMREMGYIGVKQPEGCLDGAQSVDIAKEYFRTRSVELSGVLERYNQFDCQVLYELVVFLQKYYYLY